MTRIAIQFFGHLRTFEKCFPALKRHLLNHYDCDIFMHTWDTYNHNTKTWHTDFKNTNKPVDKQYLMEKLGIGDEQIAIEHQEIYDTGHYISRGREWGLQGVASMYRSITAVNKLREKYQKKHKVKYDLVLCIRPDILLYEDLNLDKYINDKLNDGKNIYFAGHTTDRDMYGMNYIETVDLIFFGTPNAMTQFCSDLIIPIKDGDYIDYFPDGFLIDNIYRANLRPVYIGTYQYNKSFKIKRCSMPKINRSGIITFHIRKNGIYIALLRLLPAIFNVKIKISRFFTIDFSIGTNE